MTEKDKSESGVAGMSVPGELIGPPSTPKDREHWAVTVHRNGDGILTIESAMLAGKPDLDPEDEACIEMCARQLLAFLGFREPPSDCMERLRGIREAYCQAARRVPTDPELAAYRYGKAAGISEVLQLLHRSGVECVSPGDTHA